MVHHARVMHIHHDDNVIMMDDVWMVLLPRIVWHNTPS